jgi:hypothetical protein
MKIYHREKKEELIFVLIENRKSDIETSGIKKLMNILKSEYRNIENSVTITFEHKTVYDKIQEFSVNKKEDPFLDVEDLLKNINNRVKREDEDNFDIKKLEKILCELHQLGMII